MFASSAVRAASRQVVASSVRRQFSSVAAKTVVKQTAGSSSSSSARAAAPFLAAAGLAVTATMLQKREERTFNLFGGSDAVQKAVKEVEDKFGSYWPRNILILFGPPGRFI